jgi:hypothetical protein
MTHPLQAALLLAPAVILACSAGHSVPQDVDLAATAETMGEDGAPPQPIVTFFGTLLDTDGAPIPAAMLILCGNVAGKEVCKQKFTDDNGDFRYELEGHGYTHLQFFTYTATLQTGKLYGGASIDVTFLPEPPAEYNLQTVILPLAETPFSVSVAEGATLNMGHLTLAISPDSLAFPDLGESGELALATAPLADLPFTANDPLAAWAFFPFDAGLSEPAELTFPVTAIEGFEPGASVIYVNSADQGGLYEVDYGVSEETVTLQLDELTWLIVK